MDFMKRMSKIVSSSDLKEMIDIMDNEKEVFSKFLNVNQIQLEDWIQHVLEAYSEGGLVAAS